MDTCAGVRTRVGVADMSRNLRTRTRAAVYCIWRCHAGGGGRRYLVMKICHTLLRMSKEKPV